MFLSSWLRTALDRVGSARVATGLGLCAALTGLALGCIPPDLRGPEDFSGSESSPFEVGPYLLRQAPDRVLVVLKHPLPEPPRVEYWVVCEGCDPSVAPAAGPRVSLAEPHEDHWVGVLTGLPRERREIAYRVIARSARSRVRTFRAGALRGEAFRFAVYGDTRTGHAVHRAVVEAAAREQVDFLVHTGDLVEFGGRDEQWDRFFQIEQPLLEGAPIFPAIGNHDVSTRNDFGRNFLTVLWTDTLNYYYQDWGNLRILTVDSGIECRDGCTQSYFARVALAEGARRGMLMMISLHFPPYSSGTHGSYLRLREAVKPLARKYGVELVVAGHNHDHERTRALQGTTYLVAAAAGAPVRMVRPKSFSRVVRTEPHYVLVDVRPDRLALRAVNLQGSTFDSAILTPTPPEASRAELAEEVRALEQPLAEASRRANERRPLWARFDSR